MIRYKTLGFREAFPTQGISLSECPVYFLLMGAEPQRILFISSLQIDYKELRKTWIQSANVQEYWD